MIKIHPWSKSINGKSIWSGPHYMYERNDWRKYWVVSMSPKGSTFFSIVSISTESFFNVMLSFNYQRVTSSWCYKFNAMYGKLILPSLAGNKVLRLMSAFIICAFNFSPFICFVFYSILARFSWFYEKARLNSSCFAYSAEVLILTPWILRPSFLRMPNAINTFRASYTRRLIFC